MAFFISQSVSLNLILSLERKEKKKKVLISSWGCSEDQMEKNVRSPGLDEKKAQTTPFLFLISQDVEMYPHQPAALMFLSLDSSWVGACMLFRLSLLGLEVPSSL